MSPHVWLYDGHFAFICYCRGYFEGLAPLLAWIIDILLYYVDKLEREL
jgi:hypothetical protein